MFTPLPTLWETECDFKSLNVLRLLNLKYYYCNYAVIYLLLIFINNIFKMKKKTRLSKKQQRSFKSKHGEPHDSEREKILSVQQDIRSLMHVLH